MSQAQERYEAEQAALRAEYEGETAPLEITVPREPEVNPEVYRDVEPILYRGFLAVAAEINDVYFVFKSLNHHEFELLHFMGAFKGQVTTTASWSTFLAYGVFMVDGINVLPRRDDWMPKIAQVFQSLPVEARDKVVRHIGELNRRATRAVHLVEAYSMETSSRYRWLQLRGLDFTSPAVTGIAGTERIGLNWGQQLWRAINQVEDRNDEHEREWENAKFVGSCFAGKGLSKVYNQDTERRRKDKDERLRRKDEILREYVLGEKPQASVVNIPGAVMQGPRTVEELAKQLAKDLRGERDFHDEVVSEYEAKIRERHAERKAELAALSEETRREYGNHAVVSSQSMVGLTPAQAEEAIRTRKQLLAQSLARLQVPRATSEESAAAFMDRWGFDDDPASELPSTDRDVSEAHTLPPPRDRR